jgi:predicted transposase YdaD
MKKNSSEVINMLLQEWNQETCYRVSFIEGKEQGKEEGILVGKEEGILVGKEQGILVGKEQGAEQTKLKLARRMLARKMPLDEIADISLLPIETIQALQKSEL